MRRLSLRQFTLLGSVAKLGGAEHTIIPDRIEAGTFIKRDARHQPGADASIQLSCRDPTQVRAVEDLETVRCRSFISFDTHVRGVPWFAAFDNRMDAFRSRLH